MGDPRRALSGASPFKTHLLALGTPAEGGPGLHPQEGAWGGVWRVHGRGPLKIKSLSTGKRTGWWQLRA